MGNGCGDPSRRRAPRLEDLHLRLVPRPEDHGHLGRCSPAPARPASVPPRLRGRARRRRAPVGGTRRRSPAGSSTSATISMPPSASHLRIPTRVIGSRFPSSTRGDLVGTDTRSTLRLPRREVLESWWATIGATSRARVGYERFRAVALAFAPSTSSTPWPGTSSVALRLARRPRCAPGTRSFPAADGAKRNRPSASDAAHRPAGRERHPRVRRPAPPSASRTSAAGAVDLLHRAPRSPPGRRTGRSACAPRGRAGSGSRDRRGVHDVVDRRLVLAADRRPEVGLVLGAALRGLRVERERLACRSRACRRGCRPGASSTRRGPRAPARAGGARPRPRASTQ